MIPLQWATGDKCVVRGHAGVVTSIGPECASVRINEWRNIFCGLDELELVPPPPDPATISTLPAPPDETIDYSAFVTTKLTRAPSTGLSSLPELHPSLFPFQRDLVGWALRRGRAALFADTGLGKTAMQIEWARHVPGDVLILAPLAVAAQTSREGERLGVPVKVCRDGSDVEPGVNVTNYDRLHRFDTSRFTGVVLDESSIIKHHNAKTLATLLEAFAQTQFKLCATATPSPNDYTELGTHAEFLGVCSRVEMLAEHFVHDGGDTSKWRLKGHARAAFWRWMSSWAALIRKPGDLGYDDAGYDLPELRITQHTIAGDPDQVKAQGLLFAEPARSLTERRAARKASLPMRVQRVVDLVTQGCEQCEQEKSNSLTTANTTEPTSTAGGSDLPQSSSDTTRHDALATPPTRQSGRKRARKPATGSNGIQRSDSLSASESTDSPRPSTTPWPPSREGAPSAERPNQKGSPVSDSTSTTAIGRGRSADSSAPNAIAGSATSERVASFSSEHPSTCTCPASERWVVWCELNEEQDTLARVFGRDCISIQGSDEPLIKEQRLLAFLRGEGRILLTKPRIAGWGINMQSLARMAFVGVKDSWESYYQAIRRCWRFGQKRPVEVHVFASELEGEVVANLRRKERDALAMAEQLSAETREAVRAEVRGSVRDTNDYTPAVTMARPAWLQEAS